MNFQKANSAHLSHARDQISSKYCMRAGMWNNEVCLCGLSCKIATQIIYRIYLICEILTMINYIWYEEIWHLSNYSTSFIYRIFAYDNHILANKLNSFS